MQSLKTLQFLFGFFKVIMKFLLAFVLVVASVSARPAESEIDWTDVIPIWQLKAKENRTPFNVQRDRRIVNGQPAAPHQFPYQV